MRSVFGRRAGLRAGSAGRHSSCSCWAAAIVRPTCCLQTAWQLFGGVAPGYPRVQAICDYVHQPHCLQLPERPRHPQRRGSVQRTDRRLPRLCASGHRLLPLHEYSGAILHRIPERSGNAASLSASAISRRGSRPGSAAAGTRSIPRNNVPRVGRVLMARGRDACDVAIATTFGPNMLESFRVWTDEIPSARRDARSDSRTDVVSHGAPLHRLSLPRARQLGEHRMMFRPRESHDLRLIRTIWRSRRSPLICAGCTILSTTPSPSPLLRGPPPSSVSKAA